MLPPIFTERFDQLMRGKFEELVPQSQTEFSRRSAELAARGQGSPSNLPALRHENTVWLLTRWIQAALEAIIRLSLLHNIPHSETLASDLKALLEAQASETWCRGMVENYFALDDQQRGSYNWELLQQRRIALNRANTEIDLLVDGIRTRTQATTVQAKELEQKFGILLSAKQAQIDFEIWAGELKSSSGSIAILFVDIDNFKPLNTRHTETIIDETVLPDAMKLIQNLILFRGGCI